MATDVEEKVLDVVQPLLEMAEGKGDIENWNDGVVDLLKVVNELLLHAIDETRREMNESFVRQLKERKYLIQHDGMASEYLQELINDYEEEMEAGNEI